MNLSHSMCQSCSPLIDGENLNLKQKGRIRHDAPRWEAPFTIGVVWGALHNSNITWSRQRAHGKGGLGRNQKRRSLTRNERAPLINRGSGVPKREEHANMGTDSVAHYMICLLQGGPGIVTVHLVPVHERASGIRSHIAEVSRPHRDPGSLPHLHAHHGLIPPCSIATGDNSTIHQKWAAKTSCRSACRSKH